MKRRSFALSKPMTSAGSARSLFYRSYQPCYTVRGDFSSHHGF